MVPVETDHRYEQLRGLLVKARTDKKLSQVALGERLGKTQIWISRYECGGRGVDVIEFLDIAKAIGVDPCRLLRKLHAVNR
jgi:transcriptional regulator with XRE-family HTH domain